MPKNTISTKTTAFFFVSYDLTKPGYDFCNLFQHPCLKTPSKSNLSTCKIILGLKIESFSWFSNGVVIIINKDDTSTDSSDYKNCTKNLRFRDDNYYAYLRLERKNVVVSGLFVGVRNEDFQE